MGTEFKNSIWGHVESDMLTILPRCQLDITDHGSWRSLGWRYKLEVINIKWYFQLWLGGMIGKEEVWGCLEIFGTSKEKAKVKVLVTQSCPTFCDPTDEAPLSIGFSRQEYCSGLPFPSPGDLPHQEIEPGCPSYHLSHQGSPKGKGSLGEKSEKNRPMKREESWGHFLDLFAVVFTWIKM